MKILSSEEQLESLSRDAGMVRIRPRAGYMAESEEDVVEVMRRSAEQGVSITPRGGGTSIPSQAIGKGYVVMQDRTRVALLASGSVRCEPGLVKADLNRVLEPGGRWMPVDPSSYLSCTVGGMVANNSSGIRTPKYGSTVDFVEGLDVVCPGDGPASALSMPMDEVLHSGGRVGKAAALILDNWKEIVDEQPRVTKNSSGYRLEKTIHDGLFDLPKLFVGSEGTLGVFTEITFKTRPRPQSKALLAVDAKIGELARVVAAFLEHSPSAVELVDKSVFRRMGMEGRVSKYSRKEGDYLVFCELEGTEAEVQAGLEDAAGSAAGGYEPLVITSASEVADAWGVRNETLKLAMDVKEGSRILLPGVEDLVVPPGRLADLVRLLVYQFESRGLSHMIYGHAADANLHARPLLDPDSSRERRILEEIMEESFEAVWKMGGSMTGEHGDGMLRAPYVQRQYPRTFPIMQEVRSLFDPKHMLNPGVKII
ncbi:MAG: FAD-binding oxidoreductase [Thaumarchaeota archaeon]|nr:FAD-binding oxidoreductase [Nitrososphaerota archaeon]